VSDTVGVRHGGFPSRRGGDHGRIRTRPVIALVCFCVCAALVGAAHGDAAGRSYVRHVTNPWFPLTPGTRYLYVGVKDGKPSRDVVTVLAATRTIQGVVCTAVSDLLYERGKLEERTTDWYAQDRAGDVWYFGEDTAELDRNGHVTSTEGTWLAGRNGARAGIYMPAQPQVGQTGRQEYLKGHAEDHFKVIGVFGRNAVLTQEWTPLEPGVLDHKLYVRGTGTVVEQTEHGPNERNELVSMKRP
jgi:hypothetical protein